MKKRVPLAAAVGICLITSACAARPIPINPDLIFSNEELFQAQNASTGISGISFAGALETVEHRPYITANDDMARPNAPLTRAEAVEIIYNLMKVKPQRPSIAIYSDIPQGAWYQEMAESMGALGVLELYGPLFAGDNELTRAEFTALLVQFFDKPAGGNSFQDVPNDYWAYQEITAGSALGWFAGGKESRFHPDDPITRGEAVAIVNRALGRVPDREAINNRGNFLLYLDLPTDHWAFYDIMEASLPHQYEHADGGGELWSTCYLPEAQRAPGFHLVDGKLFYVQENRFYARNTRIGLLEFGNEGYYTTGDPGLDQQLTEIVQNKTVPEWDPELNLQVLYRYVCDNFDYQPDEMLSPGEEGWEARFAMKILENGQGNCYGFAGLMTVLARKLGYQAKGVSGEFQNDFQGFTSHGWVEVAVENEILLCDPEIEGVYAANRNLDWDLFMKHYGETPTYYSIDGVALGQDG